jgi:hypothetical protein
VWFYPAIVGAALVIIAIVVAIVCAIRCCCCSGDDDDAANYAADFPDLYNMNTAPPLAYRGPSVAHNIDSLPIIHLPSALPKSGVLQGTERAALPTAIAVDPANPIPPAPGVAPLPPPQAPDMNLMASAPTLYGEADGWNYSYEQEQPF